MDAFKKAGVVVLTANDLNANCVHTRHRTRRKLMRIARKLARRKLKEEVVSEQNNLDYIQDLHEYSLG